MRLAHSIIFLTLYPSSHHTTFLFWIASKCDDRCFLPSSHIGLSSFVVGPGYTHLKQNTCCTNVEYVRPPGILMCVSRARKGERDGSRIAAQMVAAIGSAPETFARSFPARLALLLLPIIPRFFFFNFFFFGWRSVDPSAREDKL
ncbi:hypothetical protein B0J12DRAFT_642661, partial [Macrophomina phaseolina]